MDTYYTDAHLAHAPAKEFLDGELVDVFEKPERAEMILNAVRTAGLGAVYAPGDYGLAPVERVHDADYLDFLRGAYARWLDDGRGPGPVYPDTFYKAPFSHRPTKVGAQAGIYVMDLSAPITGGTWGAAVQSAQVALSAAAQVRDGARAAFGLCRPPGHHAHANIAGGYCYLNNVAIAAQHLRDQGAKRVAILDIDVHHGNGTQHLFYARDDVFFASLHGHPDWEYPYFLGAEIETGTGAGAGFNANFPLPKGADTAHFLNALDAACGRIAAFAPDYLLVSLGVDTYVDDPIGGLAVGADGFAPIGSRIAQLGAPTVFIMEGGYAIAQLGLNVASVLTGFDGATHS
jgi:acetoin utilization deacetylase AcuC-like enzyme